MQFFLFNIFWFLIVAVIFLAGIVWKRMRIYRENMVQQWKAALTIAIIYLLASILGTTFNPNRYLGELIGTIGVFCMSLLGITFARGIRLFEPFPVTQSIIQGHQPWRNVAWMVSLALLAVPVTIVLGSLGTAMGHIVFHETIPGFHLYMAWI